LAQFYADERGSEVIEWTVITLVMVAASVTFLVSIRAKLGDIFIHILNQLLGGP